MPATTVSNVRVLHTSDWHLGRTLHNVDLHGYQEAFLAHLVELVRERDIDAVLVSGDIYDRAFPSVDTVKLLSRWLSELSAITTVIMTPGNHDSAARLGFGADLMRANIRILTSVDRLDVPVILPGSGFDLAVYGLPYLDPDLSRAALADPAGEYPPRSHEGVLTAAMGRVRADLIDRATADRPLRSVVMAHAFVVGGIASQSERDIKVGGVDAVPSAVFAGADYVALGHLHGPQQVTVPGSATMARYAGSPLAYSFSERDHKKSSVLLEFTADSPPSYELIPAPVPRSLTDLEGTMEELLGPANAAFADDWVRIQVRDARYPDNMQSRLRARFSHALVIGHLPPTPAATSVTPVVTEAMDPLAVAAQFIDYVTSAPPTADELALLATAADTAKARSGHA